MTTEATIPSFLGAPIQRREDPALISGTARYVDDLAPVGTLHLAIVRSPFAHADVTGIDISSAADSPGVWAVITPEDVAEVAMPPTPRPDRNVPRRFPLVQGRVLMPGDPVVAVVAETPSAARDAADLVFVDYEPLDVVGDVEEALAAPPIHPDLSSGSNVAYDRTKGDRGAFESVEGEIRLSGVVEHPRVVPAPMENRVILAEWKESGLTVHLSSQAPQLMQEQLAADFDMPQSAVRVITPFVGGGFGCKFDLAEEDYLAIVAARMTGRPVKWSETRREHLLTIGHGRAQRHRYEVVADRDGRIKALWIDSLVDLGCRHRYLSFMEITPRIGTGTYDIPVYGWRMRGVWTNRAPRGIYRGAGRPEATLTMERVVEAVARAAGIDPAEVRRRNFIRPEQFPYASSGGREAGGYVFDTGEYERALDRLLEVADYAGLRREQAEAREQGRLTGIGLASYVEVCGFEDWGAARIQVHPDGSVTCFVETLDQGQGHRTSFAQLVAGVLGLDISRVRIEQGDSATSPYGWGTSGSRSIAQGGSASYAAAERVAAKAAKIAGHLLEASDADIGLAEGRATVRGTDVSVTWEEVVTAAMRGNVPEGLTPGLDEEIHLRSGGLNYPFGMHLAVVEIDRESGSVRLDRMWAVDDAGNIVNPMLAEGQRHGGLAQGIGQALWERVVYDDDGNLVTSSFVDYLIPTAVTLPSFRLDGTVTPTPTNPLGAKGIGEAGAIGSTPAVLNAVSDALGGAEVQVPVTPEQVWRILDGVS
ncbi:MAG TPA: xanthine dehydrogenase family protein molybdopterin-binding subunit [Acidimicrobiia bacterium]|nr:xanthine dehydrogenase family protein molybdopterin-binding subunit [Acidimicrobiia bacterium]